MAIKKELVGAYSAVDCTICGRVIRDEELYLYVFDYSGDLAQAICHNEYEYKKFKLKE